MDCPLSKYYFCHIAIALIIAVIFWPFVGLAGGLAAGMMFYVGREFTQWEQGGGKGLSFDWKGILAPGFVCIAGIIGIIVLNHY